MKKAEIIEVLKNEYELDELDDLKKDELEEILAEQIAKKKEQETEAETVEDSNSFVVKNMTKRKRLVAVYMIDPEEEVELTEEQFNCPKVQHSLNFKRLKRV